MEITRKSDYAFRILRAAYRQDSGYVSINDIAREEAIPYAFARTIQHDLVQLGYPKTQRGAHGGLSLDIDPAKVSLLQLLRGLQSDISLSPCLQDPGLCPNSDGCSFNRVWLLADKVMEAFFASLSLKDVLDGDLQGRFASAAFANSLAELGLDARPGNCESSCAD